jgi:chromatin remodeling complex protein RSC6
MAKSAKKKTVRKANAAFMKPVTPTAALAKVVGDKPIPRTEVTKRFWAYIKGNKLQDPKNKRMIKADAVLKDVFAGKPSVNMFEVTKLVANTSINNSTDVRAKLRGRLPPTTPSVARAPFSLLTPSLSSTTLSD